MSSPSGVFEQLLESQRRLEAEVHAMSNASRLNQAWYLDSECAELKGVSKAFYSMHKWSQVAGGHAKKMINGRLRNPRASVLEWLDQDDIQLLVLHGTIEDKEEYCRKHPDAAAQLMRRSA